MGTALRLSLFALALALLCGCGGHPPALSRVSVAEKDRFMDCAIHMVPFICPGLHYEPLRACINTHAIEYADLPNDAERRRYLARNHCPRSLARFTGDVDAPAGPAGPKPPRMTAVQELARDLGIPPEGRTRRRVDEFTRRTSVVAEIPTPQFMVRLIAVQNDHAPLFVLASYSDEWRYLRCHHLNFLVDNEPAPVPETQHEGETTRNGVIENVSAELAEAFVGRMANATSVRGRLCNTVFELTPAQISTLSVFLQQMREANSAAPSQPVIRTTPQPASGAPWWANDGGAR